MMVVGVIVGGTHTFVEFAGGAGSLREPGAKVVGAWLSGSAIPGQPSALDELERLEDDLRRMSGRSARKQ